MEALKGLVETPLPERYGCIDIEDKAVVSDEEVRCYLLSKSRAKSITSFLSLDKCMQKTFISETMRCYRVGPRQMSRVTGISYSVIQRIPKWTLLKRVKCLSPWPSWPSDPCSHPGNNMFPRWDYDVPSKGLFTEIVSLSGFWSHGCSRPINGDFSAISSMKFCLSAIYAKT